MDANTLQNQADDSPDRLEIINAMAQWLLQTRRTPHPDDVEWFVQHWREVPGLVRAIEQERGARRGG